MCIRNKQLFIMFIHNLIGLVLVAFFIKNAIASGRSYQYEEKYLNVSLDHFSYVTNKTFQLRYLLNDSYSEKNSRSPILFYTGNEGDIELFAEHTGFMWDIAPLLKATVIFAEHRYYGKSVPFETIDYGNPEQIGYLTPEQAMADYVELLDRLTDGRNDRPVIAIGGSYGALLAAWIRMKYPHIITGALSSSGPIWQFSGMTSCDKFSKLVTKVFASSYNKYCVSNIKRSWDVFAKYAESESGRSFLNKEFKFCKPIRSYNDMESFLNYFENVFANLGMANYPYATDFLAPMPGYPIREFCSFLSQDYYENDLISAIQNAISIYSNYTGQIDCLNYDSAFDKSLNMDAWWYQTCNMMVMPMCSGSKDDMYRKREWSFKSHAISCFNRFKIHTNPQEVIIKFGGKNLDDVSNIIFSNGELDPWSVGGVLEYKTNDKIQVIVIPNSAHHIDLRSSHPGDPQEVRDARAQELKIIQGWIARYYQKHL